jgi:hypothetical protein
MKHRFTLYRRGRVYYCQDNETGKQASLHTEDKDEALTILHSKNEAFYSGFVESDPSTIPVAPTDDHALRHHNRERSSSQST